MSPVSNAILGDEPSAVLKSLIVRLPVEPNVNLPPAVPAASDTAVLIITEVALLDAENVPSATASIFDATSIESVPLASSGA